MMIKEIILEKVELFKMTREQRFILVLTGLVITIWALILFIKPVIENGLYFERYTKETFLVLYGKPIGLIIIALFIIFVIEKQDGKTN